MIEDVFPFKKLKHNKSSESFIQKNMSKRKIDCVENSTALQSNPKKRKQSNLILLDLCNDEIKNILSFLPDETMDFNNPFENFGKLRGELILVAPNIIVKLVNFECFWNFVCNQTNGEIDESIDILYCDVLCCILWLRFANTITISHNLHFSYHRYECFSQFFVFVCKWAAQNANLCSTKTFRFDDFCIGVLKQVPFKWCAEGALKIFQRTRYLNLFISADDMDRFKGYCDQYSLISHLPNNSTLAIDCWVYGELWKVIERDFHGKELILDICADEIIDWEPIRLDELLKNQNLDTLSIQTYDEFEFDLLEPNSITKFVTGNIKTKLKRFHCTWFIDSVPKIMEENKTSIVPIESVTELEICNRSKVESLVFELFPNFKTAVINVVDSAHDNIPTLPEPNITTTKFIVEGVEITKKIILCQHH